MSVLSEINRIKTNIAAAYTAVSASGGTLPTSRNSANLPSAIESIIPNAGIVHYYTGSSAPSSSLGEDGDIYLMG